MAERVHAEEAGERSVPVRWGKNSAGVCFYELMGGFGTADAGKIVFTK
jgi:hypothetical protein